MIIFITLQTILAFVAMINGAEIKAVWCMLAAVTAFDCLLVSKIRRLEGRK